MEKQILEEFLLLNEEWPSVVTEEEWRKLFPRRNREDPIVRQIYDHCVRVRKKRLEKVRSSIDIEAVVVGQAERKRYLMKQKLESHYSDRLPSQEQQSPLVDSFVKPYGRGTSHSGAISPAAVPIEMAAAAPGSIREEVDQELTPPGVKDLSRPLEHNQRAPIGEDVLPSDLAAAPTSHAGPIPAVAVATEFCRPTEQKPLTVDQMVSRLSLALQGAEQQLSLLEHEAQRVSERVSSSVSVLESAIAEFADSSAGQYFLKRTQKILASFTKDLATAKVRQLRSQR
ncbi:centromere localized protein Cnl2 [Schizosaccharomyces japonicus yFS275]|uniref:Centromere localized protein Cnl2 n=1 Tax=Schizosaccharomyces japonicus (strain yFS275 / FY16936) TaxID=402676 RepID=B6JVE2_SCHJY|nr:centromere localized protein Cnl2 [Schizosaccharomyces japonicus yFS275]EEB05343.1 centromere localized protein Cnl2 [Schizosaccharomyces japonicus yFS275]